MEITIVAFGSVATSKTRTYKIVQDLRNELQWEFDEAHDVEDT